MKRTLLSPLLLLLLVGVATANIQVTGLATATPPLDSLNVEVSLVSTHPTSSAAVTGAIDSLRARITAISVKAGIPATDVSIKSNTLVFAATGVMDTTTGVLGNLWTGRQTVSVKVKDQAQANDLTGLLGYLGTTGVVQSTSPVAIEALMDDLRTKAMADAKKRAERYAKDGGVTLGALYNVVENRLGVPADGMTRTVDLTVIYLQK